MKNEVDSEHINEIMDRLTRENLIDDQEFSNIFVRNRMQMSAKGPGLVKRELMAKGVTNEIATKAVEAYTYGIQYDKAIDLAHKRLNRSSNHSFRKQTDQIQAALIRNGFTQEVINDVLDGVKEEKKSDAEWHAIVHHGERLLRRHEQKLIGNELNQKVKEGLYRQGFAMELINHFLNKVKEER